MNDIELEQRAVCERLKSPFVSPDNEMKVGLAISTLQQNPIYGVREAQTSDTTGWYIYAGAYSSAPDFFQPVHVSDLSELCPLVLKYLGLAPGHKFIIDRAGYEEVWIEEKMTQ